MQQNTTLLGVIQLPRSLKYSQETDLRTHRLKRSQTKSKGVDNLVNELIGGKFPNLEKEMDI